MRLSIISPYILNSLRGILAGLLVAVSCHPFNVNAQTPTPLPAPNLDVRAAGYVLAIARLPDGGIIVGGEFSSVYDPASQLSFDRKNIAKFTPTGALDLAWAPNVDRGVYALAADGGDSVFIGGAFDNVDGQPRSRIAKLSTQGTGALNPTWNAAIIGQPGFEAVVLTLAVSEHGALYVGGSFSSLGGEARENIGKLSTATGLADPTWNPVAVSTNPGTAAIRSIGVGPEGAIFVGGDFSAIGGKVRSKIARISALDAGQASLNWNAGTVDGTVLTVTVAPDGNVYAGGTFSTIGGQARFGVAKLSGLSGAADATWSSQANVLPRAIAVGPGDRVYLGGQGGVARVAAADGAVDPGWRVSLAGGSPGISPVSSLSVNQDGVVTVGGTFAQANGQAALGLARFSSSSALLTTAYVQTVGTIYALARGADGSFFVAGDFERVGAYARSGLMKIGPDGNLDTAWNPSPVGKPQTITTTPSGAIIVAGNFESIGGQNIAYLAKLSASGSGAVDPLWNPAPNGPIIGLAVDPSNNIYVGGGFNEIGGQTIAALAKVTPGGAVDPAWDFEPSSCSSYYCVARIAIDSTGSVYAGGTFSVFGGHARAGLAKISPGGIVDPSWNPSPVCEPFFCIFALQPDSNGIIYVAGTFSSIGGESISRLARVSRSGTGQVDAGWNPAPNADVRSIKLDNSGSVYVGGNFSIIGGRARSKLAKLSTSDNGIALEGWDPSPAGGLSYISAVDLSATGTVYAGGSFTQIGGEGRLLLGALPPVADRVFDDGFE